MMNIRKLQDLLPRLAYAILFGYFGVKALIDPVGQGAAWIQRPIASLITIFISIKIFMLIFGAIQVALALAVLIGFRRRYVFAVMALLLLGIIINLAITLGIGDDVVIRDIALCLSAIGLAIKYWPGHA